MPAQHFRTKLGSGFIELPFDARKEFGKARPPVNVSINAYTYRSTIAVYGGRYFIPVRKDRCEAAGVKAGDIVRVTIALDTEARTVEPPSELAVALAKYGLARARWESLSYTHKKEYADAILQAKKAETRARRIRIILKKLTSEGKRD